MGARMKNKFVVFFPSEIPVSMKHVLWFMLNLCTSGANLNLNGCFLLFIFCSFVSLYCLSPVDITKAYIIWFINYQVSSVFRVKIFSNTSVLYLKKMECCVNFNFYVLVIMLIKIARLLKQKCLPLTLFCKWVKYTKCVEMRCMIVGSSWKYFWWFHFIIIFENIDSINDL